MGFHNSGRFVFFQRKISLIKLKSQKSGKNLSVPGIDPKIKKNKLVHLLYLGSWHS